MDRGEEIVNSREESKERLRIQGKPKTKGIKNRHVLRKGVPNNFKSQKNIQRNNNNNNEIKSHKHP